MAAEDWVPMFLQEFASMSEDERDAALDALSEEDRHALMTLAEVTSTTARTNLVEVLDSGQAGLDKLQELIEPADLYRVISLAARERPNLVVEALFAAVVLHRGWDKREPAAIVALREQWHWHVYEEIARAQGRGGADAEKGS